MSRASHSGDKIPCESQVSLSEAGSEGPVCDHLASVAGCVMGHIGVCGGGWLFGS